MGRKSAMPPQPPFTALKSNPNALGAMIAFTMLKSQVTVVAQKVDEYP